ncbi:MAG: hypothetical protein C0506_07755 [Anaerolinea sp.]|nr:hypothetical protein [Anaerolinea sp.]
MREVHGASGDAWIARLPSTLAAAARRWSLTLGAPFEPPSYNYVVRVTREDGSPAVLKAGFPCRELETELGALRIYGGRGIARLLAEDAAEGVFVIERLQPGMALEQVADDVAATSIAASIMRQLWVPAPADGGFPTIADWGLGFQRLRSTFGGGTGPFPADLVDEAEELFASLLATSSPPVLLHGDLHHGNILSASREPWLAIDPKGVTGEPAYEAGALVRNPVALYTSMPNPAAITARRLSQLADELGIDRQRLKGWAFAQAVLSSWWTWENHGRVGDMALACAKWLREA